MAREACGFLGPAPGRADADDPGVRADTRIANDAACILLSSRTAKHLDAGCPQSNSESCVSPPGLPQAALCQSAVLRLTQPPCHRALTDGSYSYYLTFIKLPRCPRSCMEQGCGWSQNVCPQKAVATWRGGDGCLLPLSKPTLPLLPNRSSFGPRCPDGACGQRSGRGFSVTETCTSSFMLA